MDRNVDIQSDYLRILLHDKVEDELNRFIDHLDSLPPRDIRGHCYELTIKQDILLALENVVLTDEQFFSLLKASNPLEKIYKDFERREPDHMEVVYNTIEERAKLEIKLGKEERDER